MRNNYKHHRCLEIMKRGQVAIFIIIAIVIVVALLGFAFYPRLQLLVSDVNPNSYLRDCIEPQLKETLPVVMLQGGVRVPDNALLYEGEKVQYLCYTDENYQPCVVQQPLLLRKVTDELSTQIEPVARRCMTNLLQVYEQQGYSVQGGNGEVDVAIVPGNVEVNFLAPLSVTKDGTQTFPGFSLRQPSNAYDLILLASSITQFESTLGDSETTLYLQYYPDLRIEKFKRDKDTIYTLTNVASDEQFRFATRSLIWPQGYGEIA